MVDLKSASYVHWRIFKHVRIEHVARSEGDQLD